jgi:hypothetical protein
MKQHVNEALIDRFVNLISLLGPQPRLLLLFQAICTLGDAPIKANQEVCSCVPARADRLRTLRLQVIVRHTWLTPSTREKLFLDMTCRDAHCSLTFTDDELQAFPSDYLGKSIVTEYKGLPRVCVHWNGSKQWKSGSASDALFYDPKTLRMKVMQHPRVCSTPRRLLSPLTRAWAQPPPASQEDLIDWVYVENLCWVLQPETLCEPVTGHKWADLAHRMTSDAAERDTFERLLQLASYFVAQLTLLAKLCQGTSSNCIKVIQESVPYELLISLCANVRVRYQMSSANHSTVPCYCCYCCCYRSPCYRLSCEAPRASSC